MTNYLAQPSPSLKIDAPAPKPDLSATNTSHLTPAPSTRPLSIDAIISKLDALILKEFISGIYKSEYKDLQNKKKSYKSLRQESFLPAANKNHLLLDPEYKAHASLFKLAGGLFENLNQLHAQQEELDATVFQQRFFIILQKFQAELAALQKEDENYNRSITRLSSEEQAQRQTERENLLFALTQFNQAANLASKQKVETSNVITQTVKPVNDTKPKENPVVSAKNILVVKQEAHKNLLQDPIVALTRKKIAKNLETSKNLINQRWHLLMKQQHSSDVIVGNAVDTVVKKLDEFIKDHFLLDKFKQYFNMPIRPTIMDNTSNRQPTTHEEDFKARGIESNYSTFKKRLHFTDTTESYLRAAYPHDFLTYKQIVNLLQEVQMIQADGTLTAKEALRRIFDCLATFSKSTWEINVDARTTTEITNHTNHPSLQKFLQAEYREKASVEVISLVNDFLKKLNVTFSEQVKAAENAPVKTISQQRSPAPAAKIEKPTKTVIHNQFFIPPKNLPSAQTLPVKTELKNSAGDDLLGQAADMATNVMNAANQLGNWASSWWKGNANNKPQQNTVPADKKNMQPRKI